MDMEPARPEPLGRPQMIVAAVQKERRVGRREHRRVRREPGVNEREMKIGAGRNLGEMGSRIRAWSWHRIPRWAVAIGIERRRADRRNPYLSALDGDLSARNPVGRAGAWIGNIRDERCPELPDFGGKGLRIEDVAVVV